MPAAEQVPVLVDLISGIYSEISSAAVLEAALAVVPEETVQDEAEI